MTHRSLPCSSLFLFMISAAMLGAPLLMAPPAAADEHESSGDVAIIKYRQKLMSAVGANMGAIGDILKNELALPGHIQNHASQMALAADLVNAAFAEGSAAGATDAKATIWTDREGFEKANADFQDAAKGLEAAAASGDPGSIGPAMKVLGKSCGGCHKHYRKPKEESYKRK